MPTGTLRLGDHQTLRLVASSAEALEVESMWTVGGSAPLAHWHPLQTEHFTVVEGELTVRLGDDEQVAPAGTSFEVPPRTVHAMWNAGSEPCRATWRITPARRTEEMFRTIDAGVGALGRIALLWRFRNEFRIGTPRG